MVESEGEAVRRDDFDGGRFGIGESERHEGRRFCIHCSLPMFVEPVMKGVDGATDLLGGRGNGETRMENEVNGFAFDFGGKVSAGHEVRENENGSISEPMQNIISTKRNQATTPQVEPLQL